MDARLLAVAGLALLAASCSGGLYDPTDFLTARSNASSSASAALNDDGNDDADVTAADDDDTKSPPATNTAAAEKASPPVAATETDDEGFNDTAPPRGLMAFFRPPSPIPAAEAATVAAQAGGAARSFGPLPIEDSDFDEISEAELAGEVEADPSRIAVPEQPRDGLARDFVNVYNSRPDAIEPAGAGLPGVKWEPGIIFVSRSPGADSTDLFRGGDHPFARTVPGIPRQTIQAANGLLLAHSAINVSCLKPEMLSLVRRAESHFGRKVVVTSGYRSPAHNRRVRGAQHSQHMFCNALDLYMPGVARDDLARFFFAQPDRGGIGLYCHTRSIHVDIGKRRQWRWGCRRRAG
jgi:hypothetical protein